MTLSPFERETIINYNQGEQEASVYTYDKKLRRKLDEWCEKYPDIRRIREGADWSEYSISKRLINIRKPTEISASHKAELALRLKEARRTKGLAV